MVRSKDVHHITLEHNKHHHSPLHSTLHSGPVHATSGVLTHQGAIAIASVQPKLGYYRWIKSSDVPFVRNCTFPASLPSRVWRRAGVYSHCPNPVVLNILHGNGGLLYGQGEPANHACQCYSPSRSRADIILACSQVPFLARSHF